MHLISGGLHAIESYVVMRGFSREYFKSSLDAIRDLKHQDGRWRRGRHIRVKAVARPASRFTRLSMLSNIATATSRQFLEKIPPRKYLENKSSFAIARGELLVAYD